MDIINIKMEIGRIDLSLILILSNKGGLECLLTISQVKRQAKGTVKKNIISSIGSLKILKPKVYSSAKNQCLSVTAISQIINGTAAINTAITASRTKFQK